MSMTLEQQVKLIIPQLDETGNKKLLFIVPESAGDIFLSTSLLESMKHMYPDFDIYFACKPQYKDLLKNNPYIYKVIDYLPVMDSSAHMEGMSDWNGIFDISIMATVLTQRFFSYIRNGLSKIAFDLRQN